MKLDLTTDNVRFDTALVLATEHAEIALLTPVFVPAVGKKPVVGAVLRTIAHQLDGVEADKAATDMMIDTRGVHEEIIIHSNDSFARTVHCKLSLEIALTSDRISTSALVLVLIPGFAVLTGTVACGSRTIAAGARVLAARDVVIAGGEAVGRALLSHDTSLDPVVVGRAGGATVAATSTRTGKHILGGEDDIVALLDAGTIADGADGTEGPAGAAPGLVTDHVHRLAVGILVTRIVRLGGTQVLLGTVGNTLKAGVEGLGVSDTKKLSADILTAHPCDGAVQRSAPQLGLAVHATNKLHSAHTIRHRSTDNGAHNNKHRTLHRCYSKKKKESQSLTHK